jgi:hypothetical protein
LTNQEIPTFARPSFLGLDWLTLSIRRLLFDRLKLTLVSAELPYQQRRVAGITIWL